MALPRLFLLLALPLFVFSCSSDKDDPDVEVVPDNKPTPYTLQIPATLPKSFIIPEDNPLTVEGVALGRHLFYEAKLSRNNTMSCGSCHQQPLAFTDGKGLSTGISRQQTKRGSMSLANMLWFNQFNWDGSATSLEEQALKPLEDPLEMHQPVAEAVNKLQQTELYPPMFEKAFGSPTITKENMLKALAQFQRTLISGNSRYDRYLQNKEVFTPDEVEGMALFMTHPDRRRRDRAEGAMPAHQLRHQQVGCLLDEQPRRGIRHRRLAPQQFHDLRRRRIVEADPRRQLDRLAADQLFGTIRQPCARQKDVADADRPGDVPTLLLPFGNDGDRSRSRRPREPLGPAPPTRLT